MERLTELVRILYKAVVRPAAAVVVTVGTVLTISLLATEHYVLAVPVGLSTGLLAAYLATRR